MIPFKDKEQKELILITVVLVKCQKRRNGEKSEHRTARNVKIGWLRFGRSERQAQGNTLQEVNEEEPPQERRSILRVEKEENRKEV